LKGVHVRVLHVSQPTVAGVPVVVRQFAADQSAHGIRVGVASPSDGDLPLWLAGDGVQHLPWRATRSPGPSLPHETKALALLLREFAPDLVHLHSAKAGLAGRLAVRGRLPTVFQPHAWSFQAVEGALRPLVRAWERFAVRWTDLLVCVSQQERVTGARAGVSTATVVLPNGVDLLRLPPAGQQERDQARAALGLPDVPLVVCVGRLVRQKGQDLLLAALPRILKRVPAARVVLVGDGPDYDALLSTAAPAVLFAGKQAVVAPWLAAADVVALPSRWEAGLSFVAMEAMAVGRAVVATDAVVGRESLLGGGAVVPVDDVAALADALVQRLADPGLAAREGRNGRAIVETEHDQAQTAPRVRAAYQRVLAGTFEDEDVSPVVEFRGDLHEHDEQRVGR
jgi:glycosyltransferase involved in cell wall biosynthesis